MRTKTLLIAAAALAVGILASSAQTYSQNVVGYVNVTLGDNAFWFLGNQLTTGSDVNKTNNDAATVLANGILSDPNGAYNTQLYYWTGSGYTIVSYFTAADWNSYWGSPGAAGFYDITSGNYYSLSLATGKGNYLHNASDPTITITLVGQVFQGTYSAQIVPGFNALCLAPPIVASIDSAPFNFVGQSDPNGNNNDTLYVPAAGGGYHLASYFTGPDWDSYWGASGSPAGFYDTTSGTYESTNPIFYPQVMQAFFIYHVGPGNENWTYTFNVN